MIVTDRKDSCGHKILPFNVIGPLIRQRRMELGQSLEEASQVLGVCHQTLDKWERSIRNPYLRLYPSITRYLGYDPLEGELSFGQRLRLARWGLGLSRQDLARRLGISVNAYERWEDGSVTVAQVRIRRILETFLETAQQKENGANGMQR